MVTDETSFSPEQGPRTAAICTVPQPEGVPR